MPANGVHFRDGLSYFSYFTSFRGQRIRVGVGRYNQRVETVLCK